MWHTMSVSEIEKKLNTDISTGIKEKEALKRLKEFGLNKLDETKKKNIIFRFIDQFKDFMIIILLIAALISVTGTYAWFSTQRDVEIVGFRLNVEIAENLEISLDGEKWTHTIEIYNMRQFYGTYDPTKTYDNGNGVTQAAPIGNQRKISDAIVAVRPRLLWSIFAANFWNGKIAE